jgi:trigger factor
VRDSPISLHPEESESGDMIFGELKQESTEFTTNTAIPTKQLNEDSLSKFVSVSKKVM